MPHNIIIVVSFQPAIRELLTVLFHVLGWVQGGVAFATHTGVCWVPACTYEGIWTLQFAKEIVAVVRVGSLSYLLLDTFNFFGSRDGLNTGVIQGRFVKFAGSILWQDVQPWTPIPCSTCALGLGTSQVKVRRYCGLLASRGKRIWLHDLLLLSFIGICLIEILRRCSIGELGGMILWFVWEMSSFEVDCRCLLVYHFGGLLLIETKVELERCSLWQDLLRWLRLDELLEALVALVLALLKL